MKKKSKKSYYSDLTDKYKNYVKKTWNLMKEIIRKSKFKIKKLPHRIVINEKEKDFSKVFDTVDYKILIRKFEKYGIKHQHSVYKKQYARCSEGTTPLQEVKCGAPQDSILGPLLSLIFVNDLQHVTKFLNPIMFAVDTNIFYSNSNIKELFENVNKELANVTDWCVAKKQSINTSKINS